MTIRKQLLERRRALLLRYHGELERADEELAERDPEQVERATEQWDAKILETLSEVDARAVAEVVAALRRLDSGDYGRCTGCGHPIPKARLAALPATPHCVACAGQATHAHP